MYLASVMLSCSSVALQAVVQCQGYMGMLPVVAVQVPWDIARCMLTVVCHNAGIGTSGAVSHLCAICGCTIASGCASKGDCISNVCGCASTAEVCWWHRVAITHCNTVICLVLVGCLCTVGGCAGSEGSCVSDVCGCASTIGKLTSHNVCGAGLTIIRRKMKPFRVKPALPHLPTCLN